MVRRRSRTLRVHRSEFLSTSGNENYVRCQFLFVCKYCLDLLTLFPSDTKISHGRLNFRVAKFKPPDVKIFCISIKSLAQHHICMYLNKNEVNLVEC